MGFTSTERSVMRTRRTTLIAPQLSLLLALCLVGGVAGAVAQEARADQLRREAQQLMERARERKAAGDGDEARELAERAEKLMREAGGPQKVQVADTPESRERMARFQELRARLAESEISVSVADVLSSGMKRVTQR